MPLAQLKSLGNAGPAAFVSLQKPMPARELPDLSLFPGMTDLSAGLTDFGETAALIENLDLIITVDTAVGLGKQLRSDAYEAVAGIGGGKTIDVTKFAAHMAGIPMVAVATNLSHDGIASPVSSLEHESGKGSYGVVPPVAVIVDLDRVRNGPPRSVRSGVGDVVNNLSAVADWELAAADRGGIITTASIGKVDWVEVDNHDDLRRAREIAARC